MKEEKKMRIYMDYAATCPMEQSTIKRMTEVMELFAGNPSSIYWEGQQTARLIQKARENVGTAIDGSFKDIYFTGSGTESVCQAILSAARAGEREGKRNIVASAIEHACVIRTLEYLATCGFDYTLVPVDNQGYINMDALKSSIKDTTCLVSVMYANNEVGTIQDVEEIQKICREKNVLFHCDGTQMIPHHRVSMKTTGFDYFSFSAHKFGGPKGVGCLYARGGVPLAPILFGGKQERGMRAGTENVPGIVGLSHALEQRINHMEMFQKHMKSLHSYFIEQIEKIPGVQIISPQNGISGIINVTFDRISNTQMVLLLDQNGVSISNGAACEAGAIEMSPVLLAMGIPLDQARNAVRFSLGEHNTIEDINTTIDILKGIMQKKRGI